MKVWLNKMSSKEVNLSISIIKSFQNIITKFDFFTKDNFTFSTYLFNENFEVSDRFEVKK